MNAGYFSHPTAKAMGQIVMWFTPFNDELERTAVKAIIQKLMSWNYSWVGYFVIMTIVKDDLIESYGT